MDMASNLVQYPKKNSINVAVLHQEVAIAKLSIHTHTLYNSVGSCHLGNIKFLKVH